MNWNEFAKEVHQVAVAHGWWDKPVSWDDFIVMCHCELSEAVEEYRKGRPNVYRVCEASDGKVCDLDVDGCCTIAPGDPCEHRGAKPEGVAVELADCVLRILDWLAIRGERYPCLIEPSVSHGNLVETVNMLHQVLAYAYVAPGLDLKEVKLCRVVSYIMGLTWRNLGGEKEEWTEMETILREKHEYNKTRAYRHGGKKL